MRSMAPTARPVYVAAGWVFAVGWPKVECGMDAHADEN